MISDKGLFSEEVKDILVQAGWVRSGSLPPTPSSLLNEWERFIALCKKGYKENIYEYDNDILIRKVIDIVLSSKALKKYPEFNSFSEKVKSLDAEFFELLQNDVKRSTYEYWWQQGALKYAGEELAKDFFNNYKIKIRVV